MRPPQAVVAGGGPAGLACGIALAQKYDTVVVEQGWPDQVDANKAYNYLVDVRGQRWLRKFNVSIRGISNDDFKVRRVTRDRTETIVPPIASPGAFWISRADLLRTLAAKAEATPNLRVLYNTTFRLDDWPCPIVVGCDGLNSSVRRAMGSEFVELTSPSAGLLYKIIPYDGKVGNETPAPAMAYTVVAPSLRLGMLPSTGRRALNCIARPDHPVWRGGGGGDDFPHLDVDWEAFDAAKPGRFPAPSYASPVAAEINGTRFFLAGDAAHAFPPDLGQGINAALEDALAIDDLDAYQRERGPAARALAHIVRVGFPYQYNQGPKLRQALFNLRFALRLLLSKTGLVAQPVVLSVLQGQPYAQVWRRAQRSTFFLYIAAVALLCFPTTL